MQSGRGNTGAWLLEFDPTSPKQADPLMGWQGSRDTLTQLKLKFTSKEAAIAYATAKGLDFVVQEPQARALKIQTYAENFR
jgi:ETC complex I subunit conserved region